MHALSCEFVETLQFLDEHGVHAISAQCCERKNVEWKDDQSGSTLIEAGTGPRIVVGARHETMRFGYWLGFWLGETLQILPADTFLA